jgi:hypothetical protein
MSFHTPRSITMTESNPSSVDQYRIQMLSMDLATVYSDATYAADPDGSTTIPIGSNGSMNNLPVDENFRLRVIQMDNGVSSEAGWQEVLGPGNATLVNHLLPDGAETIVITL